MTIHIGNVSAVTQLRQCIALECEALNGAMYAPAIMANHAAIANRYKQLDKYYDQLSELLGKQQATEITVTIYETIVK